jgi:hypothetical protein
MADAVITVIACVPPVENLGGKIHFRSAISAEASTV